jgi:hypothetical protein
MVETAQPITREPAIGGAVIRAADEPAPTIRQSAIGIVRSESATIGQALVGAVVARGDVSVAQGGGRMLLAGNDLVVHQGGGGLFVAGGDVEIREGGAGTMVALGDVSIDRGGAVVAITRSLEAGEGSTVGLALSPRVVVHPGGRVVAGLREALVAGAVGGLVIGLVVAGIRRLTVR